MIDSYKNYQDISQLCLNCINESLDSSRALFSRQLRNKKWDSTLGTEDMTSTAICIIGLARAKKIKEVGVDICKILDALINVSQKHNYRGGMGLVIWANAVVDGLELNELMKRLNIADVGICELVAPLTTMESSWLLSGLIHDYKRSPNESTKRSLIIVMNEIIDRFEKKSSLFYHATNNASIKDKLRKHIANFADQIYSVQALSYAAIILREEKPLNIAKSCVCHLINLQGPLGQWWWHYNSLSGRVAQYYPVYSVHQHAMAPMALIALAAAGTDNFQDVITLSQQWISHNELDIDLRDSQTGTVWRDISPIESSFNKNAKHIRSLFGFECTDGENTLPAYLTVNYETRPYEWGWRLFASVIAEKTPPPSQFLV